MRREVMTVDFFIYLLSFTLNIIQMIIYVVINVVFDLLSTL